MSNLFSALSSAASAIGVYENALSVTSNNIANSATPGFAAQTPTFEPLPSDSTGGLSGGVASGPAQNARDIFAERAVRQAETALGSWQQQVSSLQGLQTNFDLTGTTGIPGALNQLFTAFSSWGASPSDFSARQGVVESAQNLAQAFQQQSAQVSSAATSADTQLSNLVTQVNTLTAQIRQDNIQRSGASDPSVDANLYSSLQSLSSLVPITALREADGSTTVLLNGQSPLVVGQFQYQLSSQISVPQNPPPTNPSAPPTAHVLDSDGNDISSQITSGQVGGVLHARNVTIAQLQGDAYQQGSLNQLAQAIADRVNTLLTGGNISNADPTTGAPAVPGIPLFSYDPTNATAVARTLTVNPAATAGQLAAIDPGPPEVDNGIPLALANLATPQSPTDEINNVSYTQFFGDMAGQLGSAIATAQTNQSTAQSQVTQTTNLRQQSSGVDLNEEAIRVLQFQQSYNAAAKMISVLDELTKSLINNF